MENKTKLLAEKYLYEAASRFFEEPDCVELEQMKKLDEKRVTADDGSTYDIPDEYLLQTRLSGKRAGSDTVGKSIGIVDDDVAVADATDFDDIAKTRANTANREKDLARFKSNTSSENATFNAILPAINGAIADAAVEGVESGDVVGTDSGVWMVNSEWASAAQKKIYWNVVAPVIKKLDAKAGRALKDAWELFIGYRAPRGYKFAPFKNAVADYAKNNIKVAPVEDEAEVAESCEFNKQLFKSINEALSKMYSERYSVTLDEAAKMFVVDDSKFVD